MSGSISMHLHSVIEKVNNPDPDYRFMGLSDLHDHLTSPTSQFNPAQIDSGTLAKVVDNVVRLLDDQNGEVQNLAVKCLGPLVGRIRESQIAPLIDRLITMSMNSEDPSIPSTGLRTIISNLPRPATTANTAASTETTLQASQSQSAAPGKPEATPQSIANATRAIQSYLLPKLRKLLQDRSKDSGPTLDTVDILVETVRCFGVALSPAEVEQLQVDVMAVLENDRTSGVVKKRAVTALSLLCVYAPDELLSSYINHLIESFRAQTTHPNPVRQRLLISICGALARGIPERFGPYLKTLCPFILSVVDGKDIQGLEPGDEPNTELDEVKEAAFVALDTFQSCCFDEMKRFTDELISAATVYLKYDPNYADPGSDDDEDMGGADQDDDEEEEEDDDEYEDDGNFSDEDDMSWKVRRCSAKLLATVISTRASDLILGQEANGGKAYTLIAPLLVERFHEREENVRLEILASTTLLVKKTGEVAESTSYTAPPRTRSRAPTLESQSSFNMGPPAKKRRGSDASMLDSFAVPETVFEADEHGVKIALKNMIPRITKALGKLLNNKNMTLPTKQASITLLSAIVTVLHGGLENSLNIFMPAIVGMAKGASSGTSGAIAASAQGGSAATATVSSVRVESYRLLSKIFENHSAKDVSPFLGDLVVPALVEAVDESRYKISFEALGTVIALARLLTAEGNQSYSPHLLALYDAVLNKAQNIDTDLEVREKSILTIGIILSRTCGTEGWIDNTRRQAGLAFLHDRLKNETTRLTAARAIEGIVRNVNQAGEVSQDWVEAVAIECGAQLRKANRSLRAASLEALRGLTGNEICRANLSPACKADLLNTVTPLLVVGDMQLLAFSIAVLRFLMLDANDGVSLNEDIINGICDLVKTQLGSGLVLENLLAFIATIGENDQKGKISLMQSLLMKVGVTGETRIVAQAVAQLFVSGGGDAGGFPVQIQHFVDELTGSEDESRKSLALLVLGEIGLRLGTSFPIKADTFLQQFAVRSDTVPIAAAVSLGLAGARNIDTYLPVIMERLNTGLDSYLLVHSLKEIIQHSSADSESLKSHANAIWDTLLSAAAANDDSKAAASECVGRLTILDPWTFLPELQRNLASNTASVRGMVISAVRFTFTDTDTSYDDLLRPIIVDFLDAMLQDQDLENRRLALTAFNSAASNKAHLLVGPGLARLLPRAYHEAILKPELVREVQMGPFKHRIDDGLELRKSAYETLYALLDTALPQLDMETYFQRVIAGITDDNDIRALSCLMVAKLANVAKEETAKRVEVLADAMKKVLSEKPKENAVKQELERHKEGVRGVIKLAIALQRDVAPVLAPGAAARWKAFREWLGNAFQMDVKAITEGV
ncbi:TIP120-domain-containing protein [Ascodesmis nigricans]|uniref:TIP120-domain-containing protein n=1 Tax=Ascodesmis nigricans TaxID=341454 RepID=A0A4S2MQR3_9PEZI|nr:TIP120-domain-containing protein [Ascodesmis nigricans]